MNELTNLRDVLRDSSQEVFVDETVRKEAAKSLGRMLEFTPAK